MKQTIYFDRWLLFCVLSLLSIGLVMVASSSMVISERQFNTPFHYVFRQGLFIVIGLTLAYIIVHVKVEIWEKMGMILLLLGILLLIVVLIPGVGRVVNGSRRWLSLGFFNLQVSEVVKLFFIVYLCRYLVMYQGEIEKHFRGFVKPMMVLSLIALLLLLEPDFGALAVISATTLALLFLAGVRLSQFMLLFSGVTVALALLAISAPYRIARLTTFLHPWANPFDSGYQLTQSLMAFGRGGFWGVGLGNSVQKLFYLPEAHTDFLFAVLAEELGLIGEMVVITLFAVFIYRAMMIGWRATKLDKHFSGYLAYGIGLWVGMQALINIGVSSGILPTKGLTLPLLSYGGSSLLMNFVAIAILFRISHENHIESVSASKKMYKRK